MFDCYVIVEIVWYKSYFSARIDVNPGQTGHLILSTPLTNGDDCEPVDYVIERARIRGFLAKDFVKTDYNTRVIERRTPLESIARGVGNLHAQGAWASKTKIQNLEG